MAAVSIARRAHRHASFSLAIADATRRQTREWSSTPSVGPLPIELPPILICTDHLPQPFSRWYVWGATAGAMLVAALSAAISRWILQRYWVQMAGYGLWKWGHAIYMLCAIGLLVRFLLLERSRRRKETLRRFAVVGECNHHIRNALQVLIVGAATDQELRRISQEVARIEQTLVGILPRVLK